MAGLHGPVTSARLRSVSCHHCGAELLPDERLHYVYSCQDCVTLEHELVLLRRRDPDDPALAWLDGVPVECGPVTPASRLRPPGIRAGTQVRASQGHASPDFAARGPERGTSAGGSGAAHRETSRRVKSPARLSERPLCRST